MARLKNIVIVKEKFYLWIYEKLDIPFEKKYIQFSEENIKNVTDTFHNWQQVDFEKTIRILLNFVTVHRLKKLRKRIFHLFQANTLSL